MERIILYFKPNLKNSSFLESILSLLEIIVFVLNMVIYIVNFRYITTIIYGLMIYGKYHITNYKLGYNLTRWRQISYEEEFNSVNHLNIERKYRKAYELSCKFDIFSGYTSCLTSYFIIKLLPFFIVYSFIIVLF